MDLRFDRFAKYAWGVVAYTVLVILWGAFVRATGSGAGCGSHWPLCNGEVVPKSPAIETLIELSHRLTSAVAGFLVIGLVIWAYRTYAKGHRVRKGAFWSLVFIIIEGAIGMWLVRQELVAMDASVERTISIAFHLNNTFILVAFLALTAWWAAGGRALRFRGQGALPWLLGSLVLATMIVSTAGAVTALGDTLFRVGSSAEALARTADGAAHHLEQLRIYHPFLAILLVLGLVPAVQHVRRRTDDLVTSRLGLFVIGFYVAQLVLGTLNIFLKAPVWMQLVHLLMADLIWISLILFCNAALAVRTATPAPLEPRLA